CETLAQFALERLADGVVVVDDDHQRLLWGRALAHLPRPSSPKGRSLSLQVREHGEHAPVVLRRVFDAELREGAPDVRLDRLRAEPQRSADPLVRAALGDQGEDLSLARRERLDRIRRALALEQLVHDRAIDDAFAGRDAVQRVEQLSDVSYAL